MKNRLSFLSLIAGFMLLIMSCRPNSEHHPKIGVVFGGGGAKGAAEVGVLKVLEEAGVKADFVAGTSMGAVIGGLYAAGYTADEIEEMLLNEEWMWLFDRKNIVNIGDDRLLGLIKGPVFCKHIDEVLSAKGAHLFRHIKTPFTCVATDIRNKSFKEEDLNDGVVAEAIRISMAYPAPGNAPIVMDGKELTDGGMVNNLPVDVVRRMGADIVIAIDLEQGGDDLDLGLPTFGVITRWLNLRPDVQKRLKNIDDADIYIHPDLRGFSIKDYDRRNLSQMIERGREAAKSHFDELVQLGRN